MSTTYILGINCAHNASACLLADGEIAVAVQEERLTHVKHQDGYPREAIRYCLQDVGITNARSLAGVVVNQFPRTNLQHEDNGLCLCDRCCSKKVINPSHHLLHAYYAWLASGFDPAAILVVDGSGYSYGEYKRRGSPCLGPEPPFCDMEEAESSYLAQDGHIEVVDKRWGLWEEEAEDRYRFPSLGHMFSVASQYIFGSWTHAGKTMGLAPYGKPHALPFQITNRSENGLSVDTSWILRFSNPVAPGPQHLVEEYCNIAAKVQAELEEAMLFLVGRLYERARCPNLCLSGGVALNSVANGRIIREGPFKRIFITPAAGDGGVAVGAALYGHYHFTGQMPCPHFRNDFLGKPYADADMLTALQQNPCVEFELQVDPALAAARDIAQGKIVGWFEGRSEFGPRALGHRSILCDPRDADMKDILNARVKFRESFRPYAASILDESVSEFFDLHCPSPYMLVVADVLNSKRNVIPAVCHVDGTCRIQVVDNEYDGEYRCLVEKFGQLTGVPVVLNTSFNIRGEPIVESPQDALRCFLSTGIDVLYLGKYRVTKKSLGDPDTHTTASALVPYLSEQISLISVTQEQNGGWGEERLRVRIRTGRELPVSRAEYAVLRLVNGKLSVAAIEKLLFADPGTGHEYSVPDVFQRLQEKGLVSFRVR